MHALIAIDSFKNSMTSMVANQTVADQLAKYGITASQVAIADGGEGTLPQGGDPSRPGVFSCPCLCSGTFRRV